MSKKRIEAATNPVRTEIERLNQLEKLVPGEGDIIKYGLDDEEMEDVRLLLGHYHFFDNSPFLQLIVTTLRKRRAEKPGKLLSVRDFSDFVALMMEDNGTLTKSILREMEEAGMIKITNRDRVSIKI
ncbi:hypothetical protein A3A84_03540 [Candidatus Collierbacteria bacterium RIFCSPLOWO2_01_FULL_50_23]|nr:MAG: hypothetical protein A3A84_03540 [Candidatus Collierbacteria bacterium RIFCSPLOWO2_01_FULL_50_23]